MLYDFVIVGVFVEVLKPTAEADNVLGFSDDDNDEEEAGDDDDDDDDDCLLYTSPSPRDS